MTGINNFSVYILLLVSLLPLSITSPGGEGISANYLFVFLVPLLMGFKFKVNGEAFLFVCLFSGCYFLSMPYNYIVMGIDFDNVLRQSVSFVVFLGPFVLLFLSLGKIEFLFIESVLFVSFLYSLVAIGFFSIHAVNFGVNPFVIKDVLGENVPDWPQRYVLVLLAGFFFSFDYRLRSNFVYVARIVVFVAIMITFLRAAFLALFFGYVAYWICGLLNNDKKINVAYIFYSGIVVLVVAVVFFTTKFDGDLFESFLTVFQYLFESAESLVSGRGADNVSDQTRLNILIDGFRQINPVIGLGGGGIYFVLPEIGSSHNQFFDYYVRFGLVGLVLFVYFNVRILNYFYRQKPWVVGLFISYIFFGFAHETTKYSYGSLIFFFFLSLTYGGLCKGKLCSMQFGRKNSYRINCEKI